MRKLKYTFLIGFFLTTGILRTSFAQKPQSDQQVFIQTDQPYYLVGESIHYSTFLYNQKKKSPENLNEIIHLELIGQDFSVSDRILSKKGSGHGIIQIPDSINSGDYILIAYTNSMADTDESKWFKKSINIFNQKDRQLANCDDTDSKEIRFFPESGSLIAGIKSKVIVLSDKNELSRNPDTLLILKGEDVVYRSVIQTIALQSFEITPDTIQNIRAIILGNNTSREVDFPKIDQQGISVRTENHKLLDYLKVLIQTTRLTKRNLFLEVYQDHKKYFETSVSTSSEIEELIIPYAKLKQGINAIVLSDQEERRVERLVFIDKRKISTLSVNKQSYTPREEIKLSFNLEDFVSGSISITKRPKNNSQHLGLRNFIALKSNLPVYNPILNTEDVDNLLIANQGNILGKKNEENTSKPSDSLRIKGQLLNGLTGLPLAYNTITVTFPEQEEFYTTTTDSLGNIDIPIKIGAGEYYGIFHTFDQKVFNKVIFKPAHKEELKEVTIDICEKIAYSGVPKRWTTLIENQVIQQAYGFNDNDHNILDLSLEYLEDLYDETVLLEDYVELKNMKIVFNGIVPQVSISNNPNKIVKMFPMESTFSFGQTPLFYVDGIPTYDENWILQMNPLEVKSVSIIASAWKLAIFGKAGSSGIISIETKNKNQQPPISPNIFRLKGYSYYTPEPVAVASDIDSRLPLMKTLLYWNPRLSLRKGTDELLVKSGDETGTFVVNFEGFTAIGEPITLTETFEIKY